MCLIKGSVCHGRNNSLTFNVTWSRGKVFLQDGHDFIFMQSKILRQPRRDLKNLDQYDLLIKNIADDLSSVLFTEMLPPCGT